MRFNWFNPLALWTRIRRGKQQTQRARVLIEELEHRDLPAVFYTPGQVLHAYGVDRVSYTVGGKVLAADGTGQTIAIIDAYDDPNIAGDLHTFDQTFHLPDPPSFIKATPQGQPTTDPLWALEIALDVEWAHAIAPRANILLVEAKSNAGLDLLGAIDYARQQPGVVAISMSWGTNEFQGEGYYDSYFTTPAGGHLGGSTGFARAPNLPGGITFVASTGDSGAGGGPSWPAVSPSVVAVGGTSLTAWDKWGTYRGEAGWSGSGGGISAYEPEPGYQTGVQSKGTRNTPDVSWDADPATCYYVYDTVPYGTLSGWMGVAGTSAAAPQWAALVAIADQGRALAGKGSLDGATQTLPALYALPAGDFHDITTGSNGYGATPGYDLVTGRGSPYANLVIQALVGLSSTGATGSTATGSTTKPAGVRTAVASTSLAILGPTAAPALVADSVVPVSPPSPAIAVPRSAGLLIASWLRMDTGSQPVAGSPMLGMTAPMGGSTQSGSTGALIIRPEGSQSLRPDGFGPAQARPDEPDGGLVPPASSTNWERETVPQSEESGTETPSTPDLVEQGLVQLEDSIRPAPITEEEGDAKLGPTMLLLAAGMVGPSAARAEAVMRKTRATK